MLVETRVKTHKVEMSLWFAAFRILLPDALTQNLRVASDTYTFMSLDPSLVDITIPVMDEFATSRRYWIIRLRGSRPPGGSWPNEHEVRRVTNSSGMFPYGRTGSR